MATGDDGQRNCLTVLWRIENISSYDEETQEGTICSPWLSIFEANDCYLGLRLKGINELDNYTWVWFESPFNRDFLIDIEFSLLRCDGSPLVTRTLRDQVIRNLCGICMPDSPKWEEVFVTRKSEFLPHDALTIRCRIWKSRGNLETAAFISAGSRIEVLEDCVGWPIEIIRNGKKEECIMTFGEKSLKFICSLEGDSLRNYVLKVQLDADEIRNSFILNLKVSFLDDGQKLVMLCENKHTFIESDEIQTWRFPDLNLRNLLLKKMPSFESNKNFFLVFHFTAVKEGIYEFIDKKYIGNYSLEYEKTRSIPNVLEASCRTIQKCCDIPESVHQKSYSINALVQDFQSLYCKQDYSDFKIRSGDVSFNVHKAILSSRSPVFEAMFTSRMKESGTDSMDIPDLDSHTLNRMLTFLYTGTLEPNLEWENAAKVYYAADKYQVDTLKQECSCILKSTISVSNVSEVLTLAHKHQDEDLTAFVHDFILSRFDEVMCSQEWESFLDTDPHLAGKSTHQLYKKKNSL